MEIAHVTCAAVETPTEMAVSKLKRLISLHRIISLCAVEMPTEIAVSKFKRDVAAPRVVDELRVELARKHAREASVKVSNSEFVIEAASRYLGWADKNQHKKVHPPDPRVV